MKNIFKIASNLPKTKKQKLTIKNGNNFGFLIETIQCATQNIEQPGLLSYDILEVFLLQ